jgi:hypothetical protein
MKTRLSKNIFVLAAGALASFGTASGVQAASGIAQAQVSLQNFVLSNNVTGTPLNAATDFTTLDAADSATLSVQLNGSGPPLQGGAGLPVNPPTDLHQTCNTGANCVAPFAENDYTRHTIPPTTNIARADQRLTGAIIAGLGPATPATSDLVSEVQLTTIGNGNATTTSGTGGTFVFTPAKNGLQVRISFSASSWQISQVQPGSSAITGQSLVFDLTNVATGATVFHWAPDGLAGGITGGTEVTDSYDLTNSTSATSSANGPQCRQNAGTSCVPGVVFLPFLAFTNPLSAGVQYELSFTQSTQASLRTVPEPTSLALLGALVMAFGLGGGLWKRRVF